MGEYASETKREREVARERGLPKKRDSERATEREERDTRDIGERSKQRSSRLFREVFSRAHAVNGVVA